MPFTPSRTDTITRARSLRKGDNMAEGAMWNVLKARVLGGHKFVRQYLIGHYFADFVHRQQRLVIEIDGSQHVDNAHDSRRDSYLVSQGYSVLRFWSRDVLRRRSEVCDTILAALEGRMEAVRTLDVVYLKA